MKNTQKGFTLIELLVVIAIIGILATIVLTSLSSARQKALDAKTEDQLSSMRSQAELYNNTHHNYGSVSSDCSGTLFTAADPNSLYALINGMPSGTTVSCQSTGTKWMVFVDTGHGTKMCVDDTEKVVTAGPGEGFPYDPNSLCLTSGLAGG